MLAVQTQHFASSAESGSKKAVKDCFFDRFFDEIERIILVSEWFMFINHFPKN